MRYRLSGRMGTEPIPVVLLNLVDMVRDVAFLSLDPFFEADFAFLAMLERVQPHRLGKRHDQAVGHSAQSADNLERFSGTLMEIAQRGRPFLWVEIGNRYSRLCNQVAAANIGAGLAVRQMDDNFVDAPAIGRRLVEPHLLRKLAQNQGKQDRRPAKRLNDLSPFVSRHRSPHCFC